MTCQLSPMKLESLSKSFQDQGLTIEVQQLQNGHFLLMNYAINEPQTIIESYSFLNEVIATLSIV